MSTRGRAYSHSRKIAQNKMEQACRRKLKDGFRLFVMKTKLNQKIFNVIFVNKQMDEAIRLFILYLTH